METKIQWTDNSSNPLKVKRISDGKIGWFCRKLDDSCLNCYAGTQNRICGTNPGRHGTGHDYKLSEARHLEPWLNENELLKVSRARKPKKWFVCDMTDIGLSVFRCRVCGHAFEDETYASRGSVLDCPRCPDAHDNGADLVFWPSEMIQRCLNAWASANFNGHTIQILSKRPRRLKAEIERYYSTRLRGPDDALARWWIGTSAGSAKGLRRIDQLRQIPAAVRFLSLEPLIEDLGELDLSGIHQVIVGGESGPGARPCRVKWIRDIVAQCKAAGVACFVKQFGRYPVSGSPGVGRLGIPLCDKKGGDPAEWPPGDWPREFPA